MLLKKGNSDSITHFYENDIDKTVLYYIVTISFDNEQKGTSPHLWALEIPHKESKEIKSASAMV